MSKVILADSIGLGNLLEHRVTGYELADALLEGRLGNLADLECRGC
jgi:hypothetical protein